MEALKFVAVLLALVCVQLLGALGTPLRGPPLLLGPPQTSGDQDGEMWTVENWRGYPLERGITLRLADLIKRSRAQQFHGLMGRSSGASQAARLGRKRNKGEMFVGLMGRRSPEPEGEWSSD